MTDKTWDNFEKGFVQAAKEIDNQRCTFKNPYHTNQAKIEEALYATA